MRLAHDGKPADPGAIESLVIDDRDDGGSKSDKGSRDIRLLRQGLIDEPNNERYMFYLAQTYRGMGMLRESIPWYRRRIEKGGWEEEVWSRITASRARTKDLATQLTEHARPTLLDGETYDSEARFVKACFDAHNNRPTRGEPIKMLAQYFRERARSESALLLAVALSEIAYPGAELFVERGVYDIGADESFLSRGSTRNRSDCAEQDTKRARVSRSTRTTFIATKREETSRSTQRARRSSTAPRSKRSFSWLPPDGRQ